ncbi:MAG: glycosyltransferase [Eubacterium sp.]|nr:glycosyltransferase [Eubacterium sp.]
MLYSIVIPCYKSSHTIRNVVELTMQEMDKLGRVPYEFVLVDDGSPDGGETSREIKALAEDYECVRAVCLARNGGQQNATMAGLNYAQGDAIISMDDDMQTHPSQLHILFEEFDKGENDVVYAYYPDKHHKKYRNLGSLFTSLTVRFLIRKPKELKTSSFWIMRKFVRDYIVEYKNAYTYLLGLVLRTTNRVTCVPVEHFDRAYGQSGYTMKKLINLWSNIMGYSVIPLRAATFLGSLLSFGGIIAALIVFIHKLLVPSTAVGWASLMCAIFFFSGIILLFLGLIGEYIGRMFLGMSANPQYVVREVYGGKEKGETNEQRS